MAIITTSDFNVPTQLIDPWLQKVSEGSVVSQLSQAVPMKFGKGEAFTFDIGEAEYVGAGAQKGPSDLAVRHYSIGQFKFHKTVRMDEEVVWADEDHQLEAVEQVLARIQPSLSRALDFGVLHGTNPATGERVEAMDQYLASTANVVEATGEVADLDAADALVLGAGHVPSDLAIAPSFAAGYATKRDRDGRRIYPDLNLGVGTSVLEGHRVAVSRTVGENGMRGVNSERTGFEMVPSGIEAFVGDFSAIRWGIQKAIPLEVIRYGDPDGQGDLKRRNQVAFRAEVVYGWGIADLSAFAKIAAPTA
jgi:hypothetical protein